MAAPIYLATENAGKLKEFREALGNDYNDLLTLQDVREKERYIAEETGSTFLQNAHIKAKALFEIVKAPVIADDSGLLVSKIADRPGVYSARLGKTDDERISKIFDLLDGRVEKHEQGRTLLSKARFISSICYLSEDLMPIYFNGVVYGYIQSEISGEGGFGYDPIFYYPPEQKTFAELTIEEKCKVSHRAMALKALKLYLNKSFK